MGRRTHGEVENGLRAPRGGLERVGRPLGRSEMGQRTHGEVRDGLGTLVEVRDGSGDYQGGPGRVVGQSGRSRTGRWPFG